MESARGCCHRGTGSKEQARKDGTFHVKLGLLSKNIADGEQLRHSLVCVKVEMATVKDNRLRLIASVAFSTSYFAVFSAEKYDTVDGSVRRNLTLRYHMCRVCTDQQRMLWL